MTVLQRLILHIIREVIDALGSLSKTKLVKLLYLIDVDAYKSIGRTLSSVDWIFYLYGPYAAAVDTAIQNLVGYRILEDQFISGHGQRGFTYRTNEDPRLDEVLSLDERLVITGVLNRWAGEELNTILDHVYFETAPMKHARFGQPLDFSTLALETATVHPVHIAPIPRNVVEELRERYHRSLERRRARASKGHITPPRYDDLYWSTLRQMEQEDQSDLGRLLKSMVRMSDAAKDSLREQS